MKRQTPDDPRFRTHIAEPRWQQVASVILVLVAVLVWLWFAFIR